MQRRDASGRFAVQQRIFRVRVGELGVGVVAMTAARSGTDVSEHATIAFEPTYSESTVPTVNTLRLFNPPKLDIE